MTDKHTIPVKIEAHGFEDAAEKIELMADAIDSLPATVNIKAKDCEIKVHTTNIAKPKETFETYAPADKSESKTERVYPKGELNLALQSLSAKLLKDMCKGRGYCTGCLFFDEGCKIRTRPELWSI